MGHREGPLRRVVVFIGPALWSLAVAAQVWMWIAGHRLSEKAVLDEVSLMVALGTFVGVGAVLAWRQPSNPIGWLLSGVGVGTGVLALATTYATVALRTAPGSLPGGHAAAWLASWLWTPTLSLAFVLLPLLFPGGTLLSRRWRWVFHAAVVGIAANTVAVAISPTTYVGETGFGFEVTNPLGVTGGADVIAAVEASSGAVVLAAAPLAVISLVLRFRRSGPTTRRQLSWVLYALVTAAVMLAVADLLPRPLAALLTFVTLSAVPLSILVAVTRYRLYEIDRLVTRTATYVTVAGVLAGIYAVGVLSLTELLRPMAGTSDVAIAAATLAAVAAFHPVRRRVSTFVDRRFDRSRYDAQLTVDAFAQRLRDELDLDALRRELTDVAVATVRPASISLWIRPTVSTDRT